MDKFFYVCCRRGCPRRSIDAGRIYNYFKLNGWKPTEKVNRADLLVVYTCGGFLSSEKASLKTISRICARKKRKAKLVVTGCLLKINPNTISGNGNPYFYILEHQELHKLDSIVNPEIPYEDVPDPNIVPDVKGLVGEGSLLSALKNSVGEFKFNIVFIKKCLHFVKRKVKGKKVFSDRIYNLKIAHGCLGKCTYCAIRKATGVLKSKPIERILQEFENGLAKGYKRFVFIAEDTGCYGLDIGTNVVHLLKKMFEVEKDFSLIINDFNVNWLIKFYDDLLPIFIKNKDRIENIRIPIQSGSDRILQLMRRPYKIQNVKRVLSDLRANLPDLEIYTHILVGFPGETASDFEQSRQLLQEIDFTAVSIYTYQERPGTPAYPMPEKVPVDIRAQRASDLINADPHKKCYLFRE